MFKYGALIMMEDADVKYRVVWQYQALLKSIPTGNNQLWLHICVFWWSDIIEPRCITASIVPDDAEECQQPLGI